MLAGIDAGGTDFKCIVGCNPHDVVAERKVPVESPDETLSKCAAFFREIVGGGTRLTALGIGSFGPLSLRPDAADYGFITSTPKPGWQNTNILGYFKDVLQIPVAFDTDVNAALLAEVRWGAAQGLHSAVYVTVGTGIGAGVMMDGRLVHGAMHSEAGHMLIPRAADDVFAGCCPFHTDCAEGLASGTALAHRTGHNPADLLDSDPVWALEATCLAQLCVNLALCYSPQRIVLGGGVMQRRGLLTSIQARFDGLMNGYIGKSLNGKALIVAAGLGARAGAFGALALAGDKV